MVIGYNVDIYNNTLFNSSIMIRLLHSGVCMYVRIYVECVADRYILFYYNCPCLLESARRAFIKFLIM